MNKQPDKKTSALPRREVALGGLAVLASLFVAINPFRSSPKKNEPETVKMLGEDGKLIEVDASAIAAASKRTASRKEVQEWVKPK